MLPSGCHVIGSHFFFLSKSGPPSATHIFFFIQLFTSHKSVVDGNSLSICSVCVCACCMYVCVCVLYVCLCVSVRVIVYALVCIFVFISNQNDSMKNILSVHILNNL